MAVEVGSSGRERWGLPSISPLGVVPWWLSALHVYFDSWLHERDVLLPLGMDAPAEDDEMLHVLAYSLAIVGTLVPEENDVAIGGVRLRTGTKPVTATPITRDAEPDVGSVIDALLGRGDIVEALADVDPEVVHSLGSLARLFNPAQPDR